MNIKDKVLVITGGASGLGKTTADLMLCLGAKVVILDIDQDALNNFADQPNLLKVSCDITDEEQIKAAVQTIGNSYNKIDVLINNAGILYSAPLLNLTQKERRHSVQDWQKVIDINLTAPFLLTSYIAEQMVMSRTKGVIINMSSISASGNAGQSAYAASKAGIEALTKVWAKELGGFGIRAVAIAPGFIDTQSTHHAISDNTLAEMKRETALKQLGKAEDIANAIKFAIENDYISGRVIEIDGGLVV